MELALKELHRSFIRVLGAPVAEEEMASCVLHRFQRLGGGGTALVAELLELVHSSGGEKIRPDRERLAELDVPGKTKTKAKQCE